MEDVLSRDVLRASQGEKKKEARIAVHRRCREGNGDRETFYTRLMKRSMRKKVEGGHGRILAENDCDMKDEEKVHFWTRTS